MAKSSATSVAAYLKELPPDRRKEIAAVREVIKNHLPPGYEETMNWGMISYEIPLSTYSSTHNKQPLSYIALAAQKNFNSLYLLSAYGTKEQDTRLRDGFKKAGKKLDMGKSCIHFTTADDLPLDTIGEIVSSTPPAKWIATYEAARKK
jgi:uncharacterized protein YdhG (YjbR/CyaY superfamily)